MKVRNSESQSKNQIISSYFSMLFIELLNFLSERHNFPIIFCYFFLFLHDQLIQSRVDGRYFVSIFGYNIEEGVGQVNQVGMNQLNGPTEDGIVDLVVVPHVVIVNHEGEHFGDAEADEGDPCCDKVKIRLLSLSIQVTQCILPFHSWKGTMFARILIFGGTYLKEYRGGLLDLPIREFMSLLTEFKTLFLCIYPLIIVMIIVVIIFGVYITKPSIFVRKETNLLSIKKEIVL